LRKINARTTPILLERLMPSTARRRRLTRVSRGTRIPAAVLVRVGCRWCGEAIELAAVGDGVELPDAAAFLATHRECLERSLAVVSEPDHSA
jgi:hypothetical protein